MNYIFKAFTTAAIFSASIMAHAHDNNIVDVIEKSFDVDSAATFKLDNVNGSVEIQGWSENQIKVTATIKAQSQNARDNVSIDMSQTSRGVIVDTEYDSQGNWGNKRGNNVSVNYEVFLPTSANISKIDLVNGSLIIEGVEGEVNVNLVNGSINAKGLVANSDISSVNGSINVQYQQVDSTLSKISLETVNGSIKLYVPKNIEASVDAETMHGSIKNDFGLSVTKNLFSGKSLSGDIASGDVRISLESVNGSIKLLKD